MGERLMAQSMALNAIHMIFQREEWKSLATNIFRQSNHCALSGFSTENFNSTGLGGPY